MPGNPARPIDRRATLRPLAATLAALAALAPTPGKADFFDGVRKTFKTDIPHFFQDDVPCAFGHQPTSHTRTSCKNKPPQHPTPEPHEQHLRQGGG